MSLSLLIIIGGVVLFIIVLFAMLNQFLVKASTGEAIVKTGFGLTHPHVSMSSAIVVPLIHRVGRLDLTVKTVRINRRGKDSLSCADGIRAEVEVDFYIKINPMEGDITRVAMTVGCERATHTEKLRELFEAKFADALKTAGSKLSFDHLYQNRKMFRDEILVALGQEGGGDVILNGYRLDDVAIQHLEQLPLHMHDENNVLDAKGRKEIAMRTSTEAELANKRLREREITIAEQDREAKTKQLLITQDLQEKAAKQEREVQESQARERSSSQQTLSEQERLAKEAEIQKEKGIRIAEERKQQDILTVQIEREKINQIAQQEKEKQIEIAKIQREVAESSALKDKLKMMEETAKQEAEKIKAEEAVNTVRALEIANRQRQIEVIDAEKSASVEREMKKVEFDLKAYELITVAKAKLEAADLDSQSAEKQAKSILTVGTAEAEAHKLQLEANNVMSRMTMVNNIAQQVIPLLPQLVAELMKPAEKIDSIKVLHINGMPQFNGGNGGDANGGGNGFNMGNIAGTLMQAGMLLPVVKEVVRLMKSSNNPELLDTIQEIPGGKELMAYLEEKGNS
ncbi:MAG: flotillin family protein [Bacteroidia bacterium]